MSAAAETTATEIAALAARWTASNPQDAKRIASGLELALAGKVSHLRDDVYRVESRTQAEPHAVTPGYCDCADHQFRAAKGNRCAHRWAAAFAVKCALFVPRDPDTYAGPLEGPVFEACLRAVIARQESRQIASAPRFLSLVA